MPRTDGEVFIPKLDSKSGINPQVREALQEPFPDEKNLAEILLCVGFFFIYLVEEVFHTANESLAKRSRKLGKSLFWVSLSKLENM